MSLKRAYRNNILINPNPTQLEKLNIGFSSLNFELTDFSIGSQYNRYEVHHYPSNESDNIPASIELLEVNVPTEKDFKEKAELLRNHFGAPDVATWEKPNRGATMYPSAKHEGVIRARDAAEILRFYEGQFMVVDMHAYFDFLDVVQFKSVGLKKENLYNPFWGLYSSKI